MSGLSPVPRIPKRCSTMNGSEAATTAASSSGSPLRSAPRSPSTRGSTYSAEPAATTAIAMIAVVPWPPSWTVPQAMGHNAARPTAGARRDQRRRPHAMRIAEPASAAAPRQTTKAHVGAEGPGHARRA